MPTHFHKLHPNESFFTNKSAMINLSNNILDKGLLITKRQSLPYKFIDICVFSNIYHLFPTMSNKIISAEIFETGVYAASAALSDGWR